MTPSPFSVGIDLEAADTSRALAILNVAPGSSVLNVGAEDGSVARRLVERGSRVVTVAADPEAARGAEEYCERVVVGDVEEIDLVAALDGAAFDVVLLLDVLQYVRDPVKTLKAAAERLKPTGRVIVSVPNVTHAARRLQLLAGRFQQADRDPHPHVFERAAVERLFKRANLTVVDRLRTTAGLTDTEINIDPEVFPEEAVALALSGDDADTHQFVYVAGNGQATGHALSLGEALQRRIHALEGLHADAVTRARSLEAQVAEAQREGEAQVTEAQRERERIAQREDEAQAQIASLTAELRRRMAELERQHDELRHAKMDIAVKDEQLAALHAELAPLRARLDQLDALLRQASHRSLDRAKALSRRAPRLHRRLKRLAKWIEARRR